MIARIDGWLLLKLFMPLSNWLDYRWHINNYRVAALFFKIAAFAGVGLIVVIFTQSGSMWLRIIFLLIQPITAWIFLQRAEALLQASKEWERGTSQYLPKEAVQYVLTPPHTRVGEFIWAVLLFAPNLVDLFRHSVWYVCAEELFWIWPLYVGIAYYFAAVPPSTKARKKQEHKAPLFGNLAGVRT